MECVNVHLLYIYLLYELFAECDREEAHCYQTGQQRQRNRARTVFTESQMTQLDQLFSVTEYPSAEARAELARNTGLSEETVRVRELGFSGRGGGLLLIGLYMLYFGSIKGKLG